MMKEGISIGIIKESHPETRVGILPSEVKKLITNFGVKINFQSGIAAHIGVSDQEYLDAGAQSMNSANEVMNHSDWIISIQPLNDLPAFATKKTFIGWFNILNQLNNLNACKEKQIDIFSLDLLPRTTIAQRMDTLSSMASLNGYKGTIKGIESLGSTLPMFTTAAGTFKPGQVLILGAGVAGLQSIATAKRMGGRISAFDVRKAAKEEAESLGAKFLEVTDEAVNDQSVGGYAVEQSQDMIRKQQELIHNAAIAADLVICTAQIPGKKAPVLVRKATIESMKPGSVVVDLAADTGGNTEYTEKDKTVMVGLVKVIGNSNFHRELPVTASKMLSANFFEFLKHLLQNDESDEIVSGSAAILNGTITNPRIINLLT